MHSLIYLYKLSEDTSQTEQKEKANGNCYYTVVLSNYRCS